MKTKDFLVVALAPMLVLLVPLVAMQFTKEVNWTISDFVLAWVLLAGATFAYKLLATRATGNIAYRAGAGLAVAAGFLLTWINAAVAIIGEHNPANALYLGVILVGMIGAGFARFQPRGMARALFATAFAQFLVPVIAVIVWPSDFGPGVAKVFMLNGFFVLMFAGSGLLFRHAARQPNGSSVATTA